MISSIINKLLSVVISGILKLIFNYIVSPIFTILTAIVTSIVSWYFYEITVFILTVVDFLFDIFQMLAGLKSGLVFAGLTNFFTGEVYAAGVIPETQDILMQLLTSKELLQVFASMLTVGLFLLIVFTLVKVVKVEFTTEGSQNAKGPIIRKMLRALFNMIFTPTICLFGVVLASMLLELVTTAFLGDSDDLTISGVIFTSGCYNATYSYGEMMVSLTDPVTSSITGGINAAITLINQGFESIGSDALIDASKFSVDKANYLINGQKLTDSEYKYYYKVIKGGTPPKSISSMTKDELKEAKLMVEKYKRDLLFDSYTYVTKHNDFIPYFGETQYKPTGSGKGIIYYGGSLSIDTPEGTKTFTEVNDSNIVDVQNAFNAKEKAMMRGDLKPNGTIYSYTDPEKGMLIVEGEILGIKMNMTPYRVYYNTGLTALDLCATRINYPFIIFASIMLMKVMLFSSIGMVMRLYKTAIYFLILPGAIAISPLDDGASFKRWQKKFIGSVCAAYSVVIAVNVYLSIARIFLDIKLVYQPSNYVGFNATGPAGMLAETMSLLASSELAGVILQCIFVIVGGFMIERLCADFASLFGVDNAMSDGKGMFNKMMDPIKKVGKAVVATAVAAAIVVASVYTGGAAAAAAGAAGSAAGAAGGAAAAGAASSAAAAGSAGAAAGTAGATSAGAAASSTAASTTTQAAVKGTTEGGKKIAEGVSKNAEKMNNASKKPMDGKKPDLNDKDANKLKKDNPAEEETKKKKPDTDNKQQQQDPKDEKPDLGEEENQVDQVEEDTTETDNTTTEESVEEMDNSTDVDEVEEADEDETDETTGVASTTPTEEESDTTGGADVNTEQETESEDEETEEGEGEASDGKKTRQTLRSRIKKAGVAIKTDAKQVATDTKELGKLGLDMTKLIPKALERNADVNAKWASKLIKESLPGSGLLDSIMGDRGKAKKKLLSHDDTYSRVSKNLDAVYQQRLDEKAANKHAFADQFDNKALAHLIPEIIKDGFDTYMNQLNENAKRLNAELKAAYDGATNNLGQFISEDAKAEFTSKVSQAMREYGNDYDINEKTGQVTVKNQAQREAVRDEIKSKLDTIINSGATRSQLERGLMALIQDQQGKGNSEAVRIIEQTLGSLKDKLG